MGSCFRPIDFGLEPRMSKDGREIYSAPCGHCLNCLKRRASEWGTRLELEHMRTGNSLFVTLTYSEENLPENVDEETGEIFNTLRKKDLRMFFKRLRNAVDRDPDYNEKVKIKYFGCGEYGGETKRPHYHAIIYDLPVAKNRKFIEKAWSVDQQRLGRVDVQWAGTASMQYVAGYLIEKNEDWSKGKYIENSFQLSSNHLGDWILSEKKVKQMKKDLLPYIPMSGGRKMPLSRYFAEKVFTGAERALIAEKGEEYQMEQFERIRPSNLSREEQIKHWNEYIELQERKSRKLKLMKKGKL